MLAPLQNHRRPSERGGAIVEFILILPILLGLAMAVWEVGRIVDALLVASNAAREGARYAAVTQSVTANDVQDRVMLYLKEGYGARLGTLDGSGVCTGGDLCIEPNDVGVEFVNDAVVPPATSGTPVRGGQIWVSVPVTIRVFQTFVPGFSNPMTFTGRATMRI